MRLLPKLFPRDDTQRRQAIERSMLHMEAKIGGKLFGPLPKGHHREFFCLDERTWIWHESWMEKRQQKSITVRYDVRPNAILKSQDGQTFHRVTPDEARNLYQAARLYQQRVGAEYQCILQAA